MLDFILSAASPFNIVLALLGVTAGTIIGSIPGLTATMAVAVLVPLTFTMPTDSALILMGAIYTGAIYGGAYAAILLNTPGTPSAIATTFDGFPMAKSGKGDLAVSVACLSSVFGGLIGALALLFLAPPLAKAALAFGSTEYFWLAVFGLSLIAGLSDGDFIKGLIGACFGILLAMIGVSEVSAEVRYTFGSTTLIGGVEIVSALIGLYCIPVLIDLVATPDRHLNVKQNTADFRLKEAFSIFRFNKLNAVRSSIIGTFVGALPGAGGSIAGLIAYSEAQRTNKAAPKFGTGNPGGIVATESANNATVGGGFIPTLVLGIPGTPPDAVILGALLVQGVRTGPTLFTDSASVVYTFIFGLLLATLLMLPTGLLIGRYAYKAIVKAPKAALVPLVAFMTVIGSFAIRNNISDSIIMIVLGVIGWIASKRGFSASPIVLGLILGRIAEEGFVQSWTIGDAMGNLSGQFFGRPISMVIIGLTLVSVLYPFMPYLKTLLLPRVFPAVLPTSESKADGFKVGFDLFGIAIMGAVGLIFYVQSNDLNVDAAVFPRTIATAMLVLVALAFLKTLTTKQVVDTPIKGSLVRMLSVPVVMLIAAFLIPTIGFIGATTMMGLVLIIPAQHDQYSTKHKLVLIGSVAFVIVACCLLFTQLLGVALP
ncbi:C4-dicarboxylate ABC transporter permease [Pseudovibrio japonicus]|uniref:C4-dicarboxylate ABC transporter permease n=1 Tax=Pseudovibrio japonicus TaxID=366534 RepID=A0ABQ3ET11_9HYPH|nr:tripartite tricarboxylate transporter permease [Pseudovibrio japonicus]GHB43750.1 C4-dicarboxylate ABC transporter permease [Pseudovibrio japonicus]